MPPSAAHESTAPATVIAAACAMLAVLAIYLLRLDHAAGLMVDDAWYILLGKALAQGAGYRTISSPTALLPNYPPVFPAVLSLLFRLSPQFPGNVWLLKCVSIVAMMGLGAVSYSYLRRDRHLPLDLSALVSMALMLSPAFVFLATSTLMTECVFTFAQLLAVLLIHRSAEGDADRGGRTFTVLAAALTAAAMLIRSAGIGLAIAVMLWCLKERLWNRALLFVAVLALCLAPWTLYAWAHMPTAAERAAHGGPIVYTYGEQIRMKWAGVPALGRIAARDLPARVRTNIVDVLGRDVGGLLVPTLFRGTSESGEEVISLGGAAGLSTASMGGAMATMVISFLLSGIAIFGFIQTARERVTAAELLVPVSLAITLVWPFWSFRFVLPLTPYLFLYFVLGTHALATRLGRWPPFAALDLSRVAGLALLCIIGLNLYDHAGYIVQARDESRPEAVDWLTYSGEVDATVDWMNRSLGHDGVIASSNSALVYLRTGRTAMVLDDPTSTWSTLKARGVRYVVCLIPLDLPPSWHGDYKVLYQSPLRKLWVIEI
jgi:hypothetical protein